MKNYSKILLVLSMLLFEFNVIPNNAQITTTVVNDKSKNIENIPYDSLTNFLGKDVTKYLGQELYLKPIKKMFRKFGYEGFLVKNRYDTFDKSNVYKCCGEDSEYNSNYDSLVSKYFKVIEIIEIPENKQNLLYGDYRLKLEEKISKDTVYYQYKVKYDFNFPFIVVGFFEKMKNRYVGQEFVFNNNITENVIDIKTGNKIINVIGERWKCIDFTITEDVIGNFAPSIICKNSKDEQIAVNYDYIKYQFTVKESDNYKKKFGARYWNSILKGEVKIGMTKEMCKLSWGEPNKINETIMKGLKTEQWVYDSNYLYFNNGILKAIQ